MTIEFVINEKIKVEKIIKMDNEKEMNKNKKTERL